MKPILTIVAVIVLAGTLSSVAQAQKTSAGYDQKVNFANYKTFKFSDKPGARNPFVNDMIMAAVTRELTARGLTKVDANPDLRVSYMAASGYNLQVAEVSFGYTVN